MPTTLKLHRMPHIDLSHVYQLILMAVNAIMFGIIALILSSAFIS